LPKRFLFRSFLFFHIWKILYPEDEVVESLKKVTEFLIGFGKYTVCRNKKNDYALCYIPEKEKGRKKPFKKR
jgi:hypothetical protein